MSEHLSIAKGAASQIKNIHQASEIEKETRIQRQFHETESTLPNIRAHQASDKRPSFSSDLLSYLGPWNPFPQEISPNDTVWLLDNTAYRNPQTGQWEAEFEAAVFDQNSGVEISAVVADVAEKLGVGHGDEAEKRIAERMMPFVQEILPGRVVNVDVKEGSLKLGPGGRNGISSDIKKVPQGQSGEVAKVVAKVPQAVNGVLESRMVYAEPEGWGVISDIDDTIKLTQTSDPIGILRSTFVSDATPITGMPELYAYLQTLITTTSPWFYLSASPYNLYSFLSDFRQKFYPQGTMILRDASWMNLSGLLSNLTLGTRQYKVDRIEKIHTWLPQRKMICVGDSTQSDPEAYGEIYRKHPNWVHLILIRKVTDIAAIGIASKNEPRRFEQAFEGVPKNVWHVFEDPQECYKILAEVTRK